MALIAAIGVAGLLVLRGIESLPIVARQFTLLGALLGVVFGSGLFLGCLPSVRTCFRRTLLIPVGLKFVFFAALFWAFTAFLPQGLGDPFLTLEPGALFIQVSLLLLVAWAVHVAYAAWITPLILQAAEGRSIDLESGVARIAPRFLRTTGLLLIGGLGTLVLAAVVFSLASSSTVLLVAAGLVLIVWNIATAPLLLVGLSSTDSFWSSVLQSFRVARARWHSWAVPVTVQSLLLGLLTFVAVSYSETESVPMARHETQRGMWTEVRHDGGGSRQLVVNRKNTDVSTKWTGGYEDETHWGKNLAKALETSTVSFFELLCALVLAVVSIGVKLHVWRKIIEHDAPPAAPDASGGMPTIILLLSLALLSGCGQPSSDFDRDAELERAFLTPDSGRFHVRRNDLTLSAMSDQDADEIARGEIGRAHVPDGAGWRVDVFEYAVGSPARFHIEVGDRVLGAGSSDRHLLRLEQDVPPHGSLLLLVAVREDAEERTWDLRVALFGGVGEATGWPEAVVDAGVSAPRDRGVMLTRTVRGASAFSRHHRPFSMPVAGAGHGRWLAADIDAGFPIATWLDVSAVRGATSNSGVSSAGVTSVFHSKLIQIEGDGVEYTVGRGGQVVGDLTSWEEPAWIVRGRFTPRDP